MMSEKELKNRIAFMEKVGITLSGSSLSLDISKYEENDIEEIYKLFGERISFFHWNLQPTNIHFYQVYDGKRKELEIMTFYKREDWKLKAKLEEWIVKRDLTN